MRASLETTISWGHNWAFRLGLTYANHSRDEWTIYRDISGSEVSPGGLDLRHRHRNSPARTAKRSHGSEEKGTTAMRTNLQPLEYDIHLLVSQGFHITGNIR